MRAALLVGSSTPLGEAIVQQLAGQRYAVYGADLTGDIGAVSAGLHGHVVADCATQTGAERLVALPLSAGHDLGAVVVATGGFPTASAYDLTEQDWHEALQANLSTFTSTIRLALPHLREGASIVAVSSINAHRPAPWVAAYAAAKSALEGAVRGLAVDLALDQIRVNAVAPGLIGHERAPHRLAEGSPAHRCVSPEEVASVVGFLVSDASRAISGASIPVDLAASVVSAASFSRPDLRSRLQARP